MSAPLACSQYLLLPTSFVTYPKADMLTDSAKTNVKTQLCLIAYAINYRRDIWNQYPKVLIVVFSILKGAPDYKACFVYFLNYVIHKVHQNTKIIKWDDAQDISISQSDLNNWTETLELVCETLHISFEVLATLTPNLVCNFYH